MNPLTNVKNLQKLNERELNMGIAGKDSKSWHQKYKDSAWIFVGGLPYDLSEGDVISVFSQYGEVVNLNLVRDGKTGKPKGFCFICYEDQRSTTLAVDNFNGIKILGRIIRVDHVEQYKVPKERGDEDEIVKNLHLEGCAPKIEKRPIAEASSSHPPIDPKKVKIEVNNRRDSSVEKKKLPEGNFEKPKEKLDYSEKRISSRDRTPDRSRSDKKYESSKSDSKGTQRDFGDKKICNRGYDRDRDAYVPTRYKS